MTASIDLLIINARIVNEGRRFDGWVAVTGPMIAGVGEGNLPGAMTDSAAEIVDARGMMLLPGAIDEHVHFRDPGLTRKADMATESAAAAAGGVTSFSRCLLNSSPPPRQWGVAGGGGWG